jgi:glutathione S-transferase
MHDQSIVFYTNPMSRGRIVRWMLEELAIPYETVILEYAKSMKAPEYLAINPMGKVPALVHKFESDVLPRQNGFESDVLPGQNKVAVITEAAAICAYLADAFPEKNLAPALNNRADYYRWMFFAAGPLEQAITNHAIGVQAPPEKSMMLGYGSYTAALDVLEYAVRGKTYLIGEQFSAADVIVGSQIGFGLAFGSIEKRPEFERYWSGLSARPAKLRADAIDNALMPQK